MQAAVYIGVELGEVMGHLEEELARAQNAFVEDEREEVAVEVVD